MHSIHQNSFYAWLLAIRPKTLVAALVPVFVASALAYRAGSFRLTPALLCLAFAGLMQIASNLINDLYDFLKGTDGAERLGPKRACAQGWISPKAMRLGIGINILLACFFGLLLLLWGGKELIIIGIACIAGAFLYSLVFSYIGLGDLMVLVFFGLVPVVTTFYLQTGEGSLEAWLLGCGCGCVIETLLIVNNYRDRDTDRTAGKHTLIVRWGETFGRLSYLYVGWLAWGCAIVTMGRDFGVMLCALLPFCIFHYKTYRRLSIIRSGKGLNEVLALSVRNIFIYGVGVVCALVIS